VNSTSVVRIDGVTKTFPQGNVTALQEIDLELAPAEFVSLIGPSGCGKSTLLRVIGDLIEPTAGSITVNGKSVRQARNDGDYGIVFQDAVLFDWRTVAKNIALPLEMLGWERQRRKARVTEMLELVELGGFADHHPWQLSGGMQQRVAIARALAIDPKLLLMDEPFGALDEMTRERMNLELMSIWRRTQRVRELLELVELSGFENHHPWQLSGGMQQRVSIARALSFSPALLLMDEPFGALDEMTRERLNMELLGIWQETGSTIVFVTHSIAEAIFLSTRVKRVIELPGGRSRAPAAQGVAEVEQTIMEELGL